MVGIWSEFGRNDSESELNLGGLSLTSHSYQIPTIPTIPLGFRSEFGRIHSECVGESKVLVICGPIIPTGRLWLLQDIMPVLIGAPKNAGYRWCRFPISASTILTVSLLNFI